MVFPLMLCSSLNPAGPEGRSAPHPAEIPPIFPKNSRQGAWPGTSSASCCSALCHSIHTGTDGRG